MSQRMTIAEYKARSAKKGKGAQRRTQEQVLTLLKQAIAKEYGDAFERVEKRFWNEEAMVVVAVDEWYCWTAYEEVPEATPWAQVHFSTDGLQTDGRIKEAMAEIRKVMGRWNIPG